MEYTKLLDGVKELQRENYRLNEVIAELKKDLTHKVDKPKSCNYCKYYIKHYAFYGGRYTEVNAGHCIRLNSTKTRKGEDSCKYFDIGVNSEINKF